MKTSFACFWTGCAALALMSCGGKSGSSTELDTPTAGKIPMSVDETFRPLLEAEIDAFELSYPNAFLVTDYKPEGEVMNDLAKDSVRLAVMGRDLTEDELLYFDGKKFGTERVLIAKDGVVIVVNRENPDSVFLVDEIRRMLNGTDTAWAQIREGSTLGRLDVVFDNSSSANASYLSHKLLDGKSPAGRCYAVKSNGAVIDYVNTHPNAVGVIGMNWIADRHDSTDKARRGRIRVAALQNDKTEKAYKPSQTTIATKNYPFVREVWIIKIGKRPGLGTGFASFLLSDRGQLIVQKTGLMPAKQTERTIQVTTY
jgi:phosphate transport system substrate-binding protein